MEYLVMLIRSKKVSVFKTMILYDIIVSIGLRYNMFIIALSI